MVAKMFGNIWKISENVLFLYFTKFIFHGITFIMKIALNKLATIFLEKIAKLREKWVLVIGIIFIIYFIALTSMLGYFNLFNLIWVFLGILFIIFYKYKTSILLMTNKIHKAFKIIFSLIISFILLSFVITTILLIQNARDDNIENANYIIILGAGLDRRNPLNPSVLLNRRILKSIDYAKNNSNVIIIVSGGIGRNSIFSEAEVMSRVLQTNGISVNQILIENNAANTHENLIFSSELVSGLDKKIIIASSGFHLLRSKLIAKKIGYKNIGTLSASTQIILLPNYIIREYFAIIKEFIVGNI